MIIVINYYNTLYVHVNIKVKQLNNNKIKKYI